MEKESQACRSKIGSRFAKLNGKGVGEKKEGGAQIQEGLRVVMFVAHLINAENAVGILKER